MLPFFPPPYPDELFYSVCGRYHYRSGNKSLKATVEDLFGSTTACAVVDLPNRLENLCHMLSQKSLITPDKIISENTMFPLYRPFLPKNRVDRVTNWMRGDIKGGSIHMAIGAMASTVPQLRYLRLCFECAKADEAKFGEAYWLRSHQVAGVGVCHIHTTTLHECDFPIRVPLQKQLFYLVPMERFWKNLKPVTAGGVTVNKLQRIAQSIAWLLNDHCSEVPGLVWVWRRYLHLLRSHDLVTHYGRVYQEELLHGFTFYYGEEFLRGVGCGRLLETDDNWLSRLVRKPRRAVHPLKHILLMLFAGVDAEEFFTKGTVGRHPFGRGPWPCLNPTASHFKKSVITRCIVTKSSGGGRPVGCFICPCGFCYARQGPDNTRGDRFRIGRMIQFGPVWEKELLNCLKSKISVRETARRLGVTSNTVKRAIASLEHKKEQKVYAREIQLEGRREGWLEARSNHPTAGAKVLRALAAAEYSWLYRHDRDWLKANMPHSDLCNAQHRRPRVNWAQRDWAIAAAINKAAKGIRTKIGAPVRVTVSSVGKAVSMLFNLQHKLHKLPRANCQLREVCESKEQFVLRRVRRAVEELKKQGQPLVAWRIVRIAGLGAEISDAVQREVDRLVRKSYYES